MIPLTAGLDLDAIQRRWSEAIRGSASADADIYVTHVPALIGRWNMYDPLARHATGLSGERYRFVMRNFAALKAQRGGE